MADYISLADAITYFGDRLNSDAFIDAATGTQGTALAQATRIIDQLNFSGEKTDDSQVNQFPREGDAVVPTPIQQACAEIALALLDGVDPEKEYENLMMTSQRYNGVQASYNRLLIPDHIVAGVPSITAWRLLKPYLRDNKVVNINRVS